MADNKSLGNAKAAKVDEFYTRYEDIESEMNAYYEHDNDVFKGKTILLPCDDPEWSEFTRYFAANFDRFGLKKLISTSYAKGAKSKQITHFEKDSPFFDAKKNKTHGKLFVIERKEGDNTPIDTDNIEFRRYLNSDGDFRSEEVTKLRDEADIIITNPPFSLFSEFLTWIMEGRKKFIIIGSQNSISYKEVFSFIKNNEIWMGYGFNSGNAYFRIPKENANLYKKNVYDSRTGLIHFRNCRWFTNIDHGKRHEFLSLDTMAHNLKFNKRLRNILQNKYEKLEYPHYDNYDALEVPRVEAIPSDYIPTKGLSKTNITPQFEQANSQSKTLHASESPEEGCNGIMGVPITFLDKYCPDQFEIIGLSASAGYNAEIVGIPFKGERDARPLINGKNIYARIFIKRKV